MKNLDSITREVAKKINKTNEEVSTVANNLFEEIRIALKENEDVNIKGFGKLKPTLRKGKIYIHRFTKEKLKSSDRNIVKFKLNKKFEEELN